jgi:hypothetical protein
MVKHERARARTALLIALILVVAGLLVAAGSVGALASGGPGDPYFTPTVHPSVTTSVPPPTMTTSVPPTTPVTVEPSCTSRLPFENCTTPPPPCATPPCFTTSPPASTPASVLVCTQPPCDPPPPPVCVDCNRMPFTGADLTLFLVTGLTAIGTGVALVRRTRSRRTAAEPESS